MTENDWDVIVVGAGAAGAVLAARLSEDPERRVLLLEAGPDYRSADTPAFLRGRTLQTGLVTAPGPEMLPEYYWTGIMARRRPELHAEPYLRGRGAGGSSSVNGLVAVRPEPADLDRWEAAGATGWGWEAMLPWFRRLEHDLDYGDREIHGDRGPIPIYREPESGWGEVDRALNAAALAAGYGWSDDYNEPGTTGISRYPSNNSADGRRVSTNHGYLEPARSRENLTLLGDAEAQRVELSGSRAIGVRTFDGALHRLAPDGEVVLSGGAIHSPALLLRSGIGPAAELARLGVEVVADLPVGEGLQDHAIAFVEFVPSQGRELPEDLRPTNVSVRYSSGEAGTGPNDMVILATNHNYWFGNDRAGLAVQLNEAHSRGRLTLPSVQQGVDPVLDLRLLDAEVDRVRLAEGVRRAAEFMQHEAFRSIRVGEVRAPLGRDELSAQVKDVMHACSTVRMGSVDDPAAVVDPECRVKGVDGLRVVDASIFPSVPSANLHLTVIAVAEHAAWLMSGARMPLAAAAAGS